MIVDGVMLPPITYGETSGGNTASDLILSELFGSGMSVSQFLKYVAIVRIGEKFSDDWMYVMLVAGSPISFIPKGESGNINDCLEVWPRYPGMGQSQAWIYTSPPVFIPMESVWEASGTVKTIPLGDVEENSTVVTYTLVWANHDICYADYTVTTDDEGNTTNYGFITRNVYFPKTGVLPPTPMVTVPYETMVLIANGVRHVFDDSGQRTIGDIIANLEALTPASDIVDGSLTEYNGVSTLTVRDGVFEGCANLRTVTLPSATSVGERAFAGCTALTTLTANGKVAIGANAFDGCTALTTVTMPYAASIGTQAFNGCTALKTLTLAGSTMCVLENADAFTGTPIAALTGKITVHKDLVATYKADAVWSAFASIIAASSS